MKEGRLLNSTKNAVTGFLYQFLTLVLSFVSRTVFINTLGREYLGLNGIFSDVLSLLSMADLGFSTAMAYSFYKPLAEGDEDRVASLVGFYQKVYRTIAFTVTVAGIAVIPFLRLIVKTEQDIPLLEVYYLFSLASVVISYLFIYKTTILTADQRNYEVTKISIWTTLAKTILQISALLLWQNYIVYIAIGIITQFCNNLIATKKAEKFYPYIKKTTKSLSKEEQKGIFANMKSVFLYKVSGTIFSATDNILISVIVGTAMVGVYSNYLMVSNKLLLILQIIFSALTASIGNVIAKESAKKKYEVFTAVQSLSFILSGVIISVFCVMANDFVQIWLGESFLLADVTIFAITLNTYLACVLQPLWTYRDATGMYMKTKYVMLLAAIINIVLSIILGRIWGVTGIIVSSAIARLSTYFWYEPKLLFKEYFQQKVSKYYISIFLNVVLVVASVVAMRWAFTNYSVNGWISLIIKGAITGSVSLIVFMTAYCKSEGFQLIFKKVKSILKK